MNALALAEQPRDNEAWLSYLTRVAAAHACSITVLAEHIGLAHKGRWPAYLGVRIDDDLATRVAPNLGLTRAEVHAMHLSVYDGIALDLRGLDTPGINTTRLVAQRTWTYLSGSTYCPQCLTEDRTWRLLWRLPWTTVCPQHRLLQVGRCPACGCVPGTWNSLSGSAPSRVDAPADNTRCLRPNPETGSICGADLTDIEPTPASDSLLGIDAEIRQTLTTDTGTVAGQTWRALETLRAWQASMCLAVVLTRVTTPWGCKFRWSSPPREPQLIAELMHACLPILGAPSVEEAATVLRTWCDEAGVRSPSAHTFERSTMPSKALQPVFDRLLRDTGRAHTRIARSTQLRIPVTTWTAADVPQLVWPCTLPAKWRTNSKPNTIFLRAVVAMILIRIHGAPDWTEAGATLGFPESCARNWSRYAFSSAHGSLKADLIEAAFHLAAVLPAHDRTDWSQRPTVTGKGTTALKGAQRPHCQEDDAESPWCPCRAAALPEPAKPTAIDLERP